MKHRPDACRGCDSEPAATLPTKGEPVRLQQTEIPPVRPQVTEHRLLQVHCPFCGLDNRASAPVDVARSAFGPRLEEVMALLSVAYRVSRRGIVRLFKDLFGVSLSVGAVQAACEGTSESVAVAVDEAKQSLKTSPVVYADETGWFRAGRRAWLWTAVTFGVTVFVIAASRGSAVIKQLLGDGFAGLLVSDRWSAYNWLRPEQRQLRWAHLKRDFQKRIDRGGAAEPVGVWLMAEPKRLFHIWHRWRDGELSADQFHRRLSPIRMRLKRALARGRTCPDPKARALCKNLLNLWSALFAFTSADAVEPTNNTGERAIRPAVLLRKCSFGTQSDAGARFTERILSVHATCRQQGLDILDFLIRSRIAADHGLVPPSLLRVRAEVLPLAA